ncbi:hypothetical protein BMS3Abin14_01507 [bacterium BMS3Abin14]|nr:hypothetical protein BMS3Abin14_01507 [bacterium BMS3Abin14]
MLSILLRAFWRKNHEKESRVGEGILEKTTEKTDGAYGKPESKYRLKHDGQLRLL